MTSVQENATPRIRIKRRKNQKQGQFDVKALTEISAEDIKQELESLQKTRERIEKTNDRLVVELEKAHKVEEKWNEDLENLDKKSMQVITALEEQLHKESFDWKRDYKTLQSDLDSLNFKLEDLDSELDEQSEKTERDQEKEILQMKEELTRLLKGEEETLKKIQKLQETLKLAEKEREESEIEEKRIKREMVFVEEERARVKKDYLKLEGKVEELRKIEKELHKEEEEKEEFQSSIENQKKIVKQLEKKKEAAKEELRIIKQNQDELNELESLNKKIDQDCAMRQNEIKAAESGRKNDVKSPDTFSKRPREQPKEDKDEGIEREIAELEKQIKDDEKQHSLKKIEIETKIEDANSEEKKAQTKASRATDELNTLKVELKRAREASTKDEQEKDDEIFKVDNEHKLNFRELEKIGKDNLKIEKETVEYKNLLRDAKIAVTQTQNTILKQDFVINYLIDAEELIEKERRQLKDSFEFFEKQLKLSLENLKGKRHELSDLQIEYKEFVKKKADEQAKCEEELSAEVRRCEIERRSRFLLEKEIGHLRKYFKPVTGAKKEGEESVDPAAVEKWFESLREERLDEVKKIRDKLRSLRPKELTLKELEAEFQKGLAALSPEHREELGFELTDLSVIMRNMQMLTRERLTMFVTFVQERIDAGIVREIGVLLQIQNSPDGLHPLKTASYIINLCKRECKLDPTLQLRDVLLEKLAFERYQRTKKDPELCKIIILEGGEDYGEDK